LELNIEDPSELLSVGTLVIIVYYFNKQFSMSENRSFKRSSFLLWLAGVYLLLPEIGCQFYYPGSFLSCEIIVFKLFYGAGV
jgi:hypothetical protein